MCGIVGYTGPSGPSSQFIKNMCGRISHRGPDEDGYWVDDRDYVTLGHTRLSILDTSAAGSQPMLSHCGRYTLVLNGEIYNHQKLREVLQGDGEVNWRGHSDTETLVQCIVAWGVEATLSEIRGMFAFAVWDSKEKQITLARDRLGEKPLYWGWCDDIFMFASELKALKGHPQFNPTIDRNALALYVRHCYIPAPYSIYQGINKLLPGHFLTIQLGESLESARSAKSKPYWSLKDVVEKGIGNPFTGTPEEAINALEHQLKESVREQLISDVPLGAFLSGGIDSSVIVAMMQSNSTLPIKTYTLGFHEKEYNEACHAKDVAEYLGTDHTEFYVSSNDALNVIPRLPTIYCEPFADSSQIPSYLVSELAKQHVTVALSGDAGDEFFGGYNRYLAAQKVWGPLQKTPKFIRNFASGLLTSLSPNSWDKLFTCMSPVLPKRFRISIPGEKARKLAEVLSLNTGEEFYRQLTSFWLEPEDLVIGATEPVTIHTNASDWPETDCLEHFMMALDGLTYLPNDILTKVDRAAMASSLETRAPFLDHRLVELAWEMPIDFKIRNGDGKWLLRQILYKHVPKSLIDRPKAGFGIPLANWLRGPLRDWAESLLSESRLIEEGFFHPKPIRDMWSEHLSGRKNWQHHIWCILMFQAWLEENKES